MKTIVVFYSWSGHTQALAKTRAAKEHAPLCEIKDKKKQRTLIAYTVGCFQAMRMKSVPIEPISASLDLYEKIVLMAPVWAGKPAPAMNAVLDALPRGKNIAVVMVSGSGRSNCRDKVEQLIKSKGCTLVGFEDVKG